MSFTSVTLTGTYVDQAGNHASGAIQIQLTEPMQQPGGPEVAAIVVQLTLDGSGHFSHAFYATDDPLTNPTRVAYRVIEFITGAPANIYYIVLPSAAPSGTIDISQCVRVQPLPQPYGSFVTVAGLEAAIAAALAGGGGGGGGTITSVFGRTTPAIVAQFSDYSSFYDPAGAASGIVAGMPPVDRANIWQDVPERGGLVGATAAPFGSPPHPGAPRTGVIDVVIGDSISRGVGGFLGATDWATYLATYDNRSAGLVDAGPGYVPVNDPGDAYGWATLTHGAQAPSGALQGPSALPTSWQLSTTGDVISDNRSFRRVQVIYQKTLNGDAVTFATTGSVHSSGPLDTNGSGFAVWDSGDLGAVVGTGLTATWGTHISGSGGAKATICGARYFQTGGQNGVTIDNLGYGGVLSGNWAGATGWLNWLTMLAQAGTPARRLYIAVGINDPAWGVTSSTYGTNLTTIVQAAQTASPLTEIVVLGQHYGDTVDPIAACTVSGTTVTSPNITVGLLSNPAVGSTLVGSLFPTGSKVLSVVAGSCTVQTPGTSGTANLLEMNSRGGPANWAANWVTTAESVAKANGCTFVSLWETMGDISPQAQVTSVTVTANSQTATQAGGFPGVVQGQAIYGGGNLAKGTTAQAVVGTTLTFSLPAVTSGTITLTFSDDKWGIADQTVQDIHFGDSFHSASGVDGQAMMAATIHRKLVHTVVPPPAGVIQNLGVATDGKIVQALAQGEAGSVVSGIYTNSGDTQPAAALIYTPGVFPPGLYLGPGGSTFPDTNLYRSAAGTLSIANAFALVGLTGATAGYRLGGSTVSGPPTTGTWVLGDAVWDSTGAIWVCSVGGTPGTWVGGGGTGLAAPVIFTAGGTWTPSTSGRQYFRCLIYGSGGAGGPGSASNGGGGGGGAEVLMDFNLGHVTAAQTVTIGAAATSGTNGNPSSIGSLITAQGGLAGASGTFTGVGGADGTGAGVQGTHGVGGNGNTGSTAGSKGGPGVNRLGSGAGGGGGPTSAAGGRAGSAVGAAGGTGAALGGGAGASGAVAGNNGSSGVGGNGANGAANTGDGGGGAGAGTTPGTGGTSGSGGALVFQEA